MQSIGDVLCQQFIVLERGYVQHNKRRVHHKRHILRIRRVRYSSDALFRFYIKLGLSGWRCVQRFAGRQQPMSCKRYLWRIVRQ